MGILILILLGIWVFLIGLLALGTLGLQGYIYTQAVQGIEWRASVAGSALALFLTIWVICDYQSPTNYQTLFQFNLRIDVPPYKEFRIITQEGKEELFKQAKNEKGILIYRQDGRPDGRLPPSRPQKVIVKDDNQDVIFEPDRDPKGRFKTEAFDSLYYRDKNGRVMKESELGQATIFRWGNLLANLVLNGIYFVLWFVVLWLVLEFSSGYALVLAIACWLISILFLLPPVLSKVEEVASQRTPVKVALGARATTGAPGPCRRWRNEPIGQAWFHSHPTLRRRAGRISAGFPHRLYRLGALCLLSPNSL